MLLFGGGGEVIRCSVSVTERENHLKKCLSFEEFELTVEVKGVSFLLLCSLEV